MNKNSLGLVLLMACAVCAPAEASLNSRQDAELVVAVLGGPAFFVNALIFVFSIFIKPPVRACISGSLAVLIATAGLTVFLTESDSASRDCADLVRLLSFASVVPIVLLFVRMKPEESDK
jgi:hypothetical protein